MPKGKLTYLLIIIITNISLTICSDKTEYIFSDFSNFNCSSDYITSFSSKICSASTIEKAQDFSYTLKDTNSESYNIKCSIDSNSKLESEEEDINDEDDTDNGITNNNCYLTSCQFEEMIKENITIFIKKDIESSVTGLPENVYLTTYFSENFTLNINKCYLVKNIFKQVSKYRVNSDSNAITFLFITAIKATVEEGEEIDVDLSLQKNEGISENKNITCKCRYKAEFEEDEEEEADEDEEILAFYDCEVTALKKAHEYTGLIINSSPDIEDIPKDSVLNNPRITDELIKNETINDYSIVKFDSKNIDFNNCEKNGSFIINGKINGNIEAINDFGIILYLNNTNNSENAICSIPSGYRQKINISCLTQDNFFNTKISIPNIQVQNVINNDTVIQINQISENELTTCIVNNISKNIIFRQINNLEINSKTKNIKFNIIGFTFENNIKNGMLLPINVNLIKNNGDKENINLNCYLNDIIISTTKNVYSLIFNCSLDNIGQANNYKDVILINSSSLINIPNEDSYLSSALNTDQLISQGNLKNFLEKNNLIQIPPIISSLIIDGDNCEKEGTFEIKGIIDKSLNESFYFYMQLNNLNNIRCKLTQSETSNSEINIICNTNDNINNEYIYINPKIIYNLNYEELFYINEAKSNNTISCINNDLILYQKAKRKMEAFVSFRQVCKFGKSNKKYTFFFASFIKKEINYDQKIYLTVEIKSNTEQIIKYNNKENLLNLRQLSTREEQNVECSVRLKTSLNENGIGAAGWDCSTGESSITNAVGLDIIDSDEISGIPSDPDLIDPALTDILIEKGLITDYSIEENLNILLPLFNTLDLNYSLCKQNGSIYFKGTTTSSIENDVIFNLSISYPQTVFACKLPRSLKGQITEIECYNKEEFVDSNVLVEETVIRYENKEFFILRNTSSGDRYVTCSASDSSLSPDTYDEGFSTISKTYKESDKSGIGTAGMIIIIVFGVIIIVGITILIILLRTNKKNKKDNGNETTNKTLENTSTSYF